MMTGDRHYQHLFEYFEAGVNIAAARENAPLEAYIRGTRAIALLDCGKFAVLTAPLRGRIIAAPPVLLL